METEAIELSLQEGSPHESLYLVLTYLPLFELLVISQVCRSFRDAVKNDMLLWINILVEKPVSKRFTDDHLLKVASKSKGRLRTLALLNCSKITDHGLLKVAATNPHIDMLFLPGCTTLTPNGVIEAVKLLNNGNPKLRTLIINGIYNIKKEHLESLRNLVGDLSVAKLYKKKGSNFYQEFKDYKTPNCVFDVDVCPKCDEVRAVFDCPRDSCTKMREQKQVECRGCSICITRCEECGVCTKGEEGEEAACGETLCLDCWLQLSKCNFCNKPYCNRHSNFQCFLPGFSGWKCVDCHEMFIEYCIINGL